MTNERLRQSIEQLTKDTAADLIESQSAEIERLKVQLSVENEPSPYCPICGSCGDEGCCGSKRCLYPAAEWQAGYEAGIRASAYALEALERIAGIKADDGEDFSEWHDDVIIRCEITVADLKAVRALKELSK